MRMLEFCILKNETVKQMYLLNFG